MFADKEQFKEAFITKLQTMHGKSVDEASTSDMYTALSGVIRDCISKHWINTNKQYSLSGAKQVYYFSIEFLLGKLLDMYLINTGLKSVCQEALAELGIDFDSLEREEPEPGLGNGGLGRLAACFLDSLAAQSLPGHGCGIRYKYGLFEQKIVSNYQVELPDNWLKDGYVWEFRKTDKAVEVRFGGHLREDVLTDGSRKVAHVDYELVRAVPYDIPVVGYRNQTVNTLRLWSAEPIEDEFDFSSFNRGDYLKAVEYKQSVERISKILYPDDNHYEGRLLRLKQQYFFVSAGLQSIIRRFKSKQNAVSDLPEKIAVHINDTHPALVIPELMRILVDEEKIDWEEAWDLTTHTVSYTNHTIMPEALEKWPVDMMQGLLPRIYAIICEINEKLLSTVRLKYGDNLDKIRALSIIHDGQVQMARLAIAGSYSVNGVAQLHTEILKNHVMADFHELVPGKFNNKTNGITHRRWLLKCNPALARLITEAIGPNWIQYPRELIQLLHDSEDAAFLEKLAEIKRANKMVLLRRIKDQYDVAVNPASIFDIHIKRIHAYKRQILNLFHIMDLYNRLKENPGLDVWPRTFIFAGKAAPGYYIAKQTIKLANALAEVINHDETVGDKLKVVFMENYSVSLAELLIPAADVSEQISTAGKEASGTGNMKLMMNGAITIGTLDGANIEIYQAVGKDNMITFGLRAEEVLQFHMHGGYSAWDVYHADGRIRRVVEQLVNGFFPNEKEEFRPLYDYLLHNNDEFFVLKDFDSYADAQVRIDEKYRSRAEWGKMALTNIAHSGAFSSDRTIAEYASGIWAIRPAPIAE